MFLMIFYDFSFIFMGVVNDVVFKNVIVIVQAQVLVDVVKDNFNFLILFKCGFIMIKIELRNFGVGIDVLDKEFE